MNRVFTAICIVLALNVFVPLSVFAQPQDFEVDILWEAVDSYTPPFYKGKAMPPLEANVNNVAIATGTFSSDLLYVWEKDNQKQPAQSGKNKNSFSYISNSLSQENSVSVTVSPTSGSFEKKKSVNIKYRNSEVLFYENHADFGTLFNKNIKNGHNVGESKTISLTAIPFFLSTESLGSKSIEMMWSINNNFLPKQEIKNKIKLEGQEGISGESIVSIFIKNSVKIFEEGKVGVSLNF